MFFTCKLAGDRCQGIIFTQFIKMLDVLEDFAPRRAAFEAGF